MKKIVFIIILLIGENMMFAQTATLKIGTVEDALPGTILVPITLEAIDNPIVGNNNITSWGWFIKYDSNILGDVVGFLNFHPLFPSANYLFNVTLDYPLPGWNTITIICSPANNIGIAGMKFFDMQFNYIGGTSAIEWTISQFGFSTNMADDEGNEYILTLINGSISALIPPTLNLKLFLEGSFNGFTMNTELNSGNLIPLTQPYNIEPWNYSGTEQVIAIPNSEIVDWILVELRETTGDASSATPDKMINRLAAFLKSNGDVVSTDGSSLISYLGTITNNLYVVIRHRNHLSIMSSAPLTENLGNYSWDFTDQLSKAYLDGQKEIGGGKFGMIAGDCNASGRVNTIDENYNWSWQAGNSGYYRSDINLDIQVNNIDKDDTWLPNIGFMSQLPEGNIFNCGAELLDDRDGQLYNTIMLDGHCWMAENLNLGTSINGSAEQTDNNIFEKYCYNDDSVNCNIYGGLYQWNEMMQYKTQQGTKGICPAGWHIPADIEWTLLIDFLGGLNVAGGRMKETGTLHWYSPNTGATNESGFTALPGGIHGGSDSYYNLRTFAYFWSSTELNSNNSWYSVLDYSSPNVYGFDSYKNYGLSVRCLNNQPPVSPASPQPINGAVNQPVNITLSWMCTDPEDDQITYDVYFDTINPPSLVSSGQTDTTFNPGSLAYSKTYYWQISAHDYSDTTAGPVWLFSIQNGHCPGTPTVTYEGQTYNTILIGDQCWFKENLNVGIMVTGGSDQTNNGQKEKYCYNNNPANCSTYGGLYQWNEMMQYLTQPGTQGICPSGWHLPTDVEWCTLTKTIDPNVICNATYWNGADAGKKLKSTSGWNSGGNGTNTSGFTALPGASYNGGWYGLGSGALFWHSTEKNTNEAWFRSLSYSRPNIYRNVFTKNRGFSVRCLKGVYINQPPLLPSNPNPFNGAVNQPTNISLSWTCVDPDNDQLTYDVYLSKINPPSVISTGQVNNSYIPDQLDTNTFYYWKIVAFDDNNNSIAGPVWSFFTGQPPFQCGELLVDTRDNQTYNTVLIGTQCWMAENLNAGAMIPGVNNMYNNGIIEKFCYHDSTANCDVYGGLYLWNEMMQYSTQQGTQGICPVGWHVPTDSEWCILTQFIDPTVNCDGWGLSGTTVGAKMKSTSGWNSGGNGTNFSGFNAMPGGLRFYPPGFDGRGFAAFIWSSTGNYYMDRSLNNISDKISRGYNNTSLSYSVRCLRD